MTNEELVLLIQNTDDKRKHLEELYISNTGLIKKIANRYKSYADYDDLCQEGFFGLVKAAVSWTEEGGAKFSTYAGYYIRTYMQKYIQNNGNVVRLPANLRIQIMKMKKITDECIKIKARKPTIHEISLKMQLSERQINRIIEDALFLDIRSTNEILSSEDESISLEDTIADSRDLIGMVEEAIQNEQLKEVLWGIVDSLDSDQAKIIHEKYQNRVNNDQIAVIMGTTPSSVRTLEYKAFRELRKPRNARKLEPFLMSDSRIFSISTNQTGVTSFNRTWTSSTERAVLMAES